MTPRERWLATIDRKPVDRIPLDLWGTPEVIAALQKHLGVNTERQIYETLHVDRPVSIGPTYIGPPLRPNTDIWGIRTTTARHATGAYEETAFSPLGDYTSIEEIESAYTWPTPDLYDYSQMRSAVDGLDDLPVQIGTSGIYTTYTRLRGLEQAFIDFAVNHEIVSHCLGRMYDFAAGVAARTFEALDGRVDLAWIHHDLGSQIDLLMSPTTAKDLLLPGVKKLASLASEAGARVCLHSDGAIRKAIPAIIEAGIEVLNPVQWRCHGMEREGLKADFGRDLVFHGAVDNQITLVSNNEALVRKEVRENIDIFGNGGGYILAPCHNLQPVTPPEIIVAMYDEAYHYGRR